MQPLERLWDQDGFEVCLFPMKDLHLTPARDPAEHDGLAMDFLGWDNGLRIYDCPCYAPVSCKVVYTGNDHNMICWSINPVRFVDGTLADISILVAHSNTAPAPVGTTFVQGQLWYHTGNYGASTGDHLHIEVAMGHVKWNTAGTGLKDPLHMYDVMAVNDTVVSRGMNYNWREYQGGVVPPEPGPEQGERHKFPWFLYANRLRERR